jgi:hypothetical protein
MDRWEFADTQDPRGLLGIATRISASHCPGVRLRQAVIGRDTIDGSVILKPKSLKFAQVRLYFSTGKTAWVGMTDQDGIFHITHLLPGTYRLDVRGWGSTTIQLDPKLSKLSNGQVPTSFLHLIENECVGTMEVVN